MSGVLNSLKSLKFSNSVWKKKENEGPESDNKNKKKFKVSGFRKLMPTIPYMGNWTPLQSRHTHYIENEEENATDIMTSLNKMRQEKLHCDVIYGDNKDKAAHKIVLSFNQKLLDLTSSTTQTVSVEIDNASFEAEPESETDAKAKESNDETSTTKEVITSTDDSNQEESQPEDGAGLVALLQDSSGGFDSFSCIVNNVHCFDLASGKWEDMPSLRIKRSCFSLHVVSGCLFAVGGLTPNGYTASVERLDRRKKAWDMAAALPATRYRHAGCVYKNEILISGGCEKLDSVLTYNPGTNEWKKCRPMNIGRDSHVMASANDKAFAIGGDGIAFSMEFYDGTIWTTIDIHCLFETLYLPSVGVVDDVIYLIGGWRAENEATCCVSYIDSKNRTFIVTSHTMPISLGSASSSTIRLPRNYWKRKFH
uniref:Uncharacterized protein n=1 Tax=Ciona savignyi TaxID=51511 RepID=H2Z5U3_CIOSA